MAPRKRQTVQKRKVRPLSDVCLFCQNGTLPDYKDPKALEAFLTDRAKIVSRARSGVCAKHQRRLSRAIKRARLLGLLPFHETYFA